MPRDIGRLLSRDGDEVVCDLCPSFQLSVTGRSTLSIDLMAQHGDNVWHFVDEEAGRRIEAKLQDLMSRSRVKSLNDLQALKRKITQHLIREVQDGALYRSPLGDEEDGGDDEQGEEL